MSAPITVKAARKTSGGALIDVFEIVTGQHRYEAVVRLNWREIDAVIMGGDPADAELWEIEENLNCEQLTRSRPRWRIAARGDIGGEGVGSAPRR